MFVIIIYFYRYCTVPTALNFQKHYMGPQKEKEDGTIRDVSRNIKNMTAAVLVDSFINYANMQYLK